MGRIMRRSWTWRFDRPVPELWPVLADTARLNEAAGLPRHEIHEEPQPDGSVRYLARLRKGPFALDWEELPVNWVTDRWFEHCREFRNGPFARLCARLDLEANDDGSVGVFALEVEPRNPLGRLLVGSGQFFRSAGRTFGGLAADAGRFVTGARETPFDYTPPPVSPAVRARIEAIVAEIEATPHGHRLARRLADHVLNAQEVDLRHIRPLALARDWKVPPRLVVELCLQAVKSGLLELRWDILCPRCRGAKAWAGSLDRLPQGAHCATCNIDYSRSFSENVEASFRPAAGLRPVVDGEYCLFGPMSTPHVKLQLTLEPGECRELDAPLATGRYRLRTLDPGDELTIDWANGFPEIAVDRDGALRAGQPMPEGRIALTNESPRRRTLVIEERTWLADVLTADRITALQAFRDLFSDQVLRPGDEVSIAQVTLMFTDLKGSTALYERIGDARAYHLVREHFAFLADIVRAEEGAIVKTVGDAVMAAFPDAAAGMRAALAIQGQVATFNAAHAAATGGEGIVIKLGLHRGPCIAVNLNDRLDYFGSTVNLAARLQGQSAGGDIVLSRAMLADPGVGELFEGMRAVEDSAALRGFAQPIAFLRLAPQIQDAVCSAEGKSPPD